jgi:hypothetical protein
MQPPLSHSPLIIARQTSFSSRTAVSAVIQCVSDMGSTLSLRKGVHVVVTDTTDETAIQFLTEFYLLRVHVDVAFLTDNQPSAKLEQAINVYLIQNLIYRICCCVGCWN